MSAPARRVSAALISVGASVSHPSEGLDGHARAPDPSAAVLNPFLRCRSGRATAGRDAAVSERMLVGFLDQVGTSAAEGIYHSVGRAVADVVAVDHGAPEVEP
jgi:hypothetical protein